MAIGDLLAALESEVEAQAGKLVEEAESEAAGITAGSVERVRSARAEDLGVTERTARREATRQVAALDRETRAERVVARADLLDAIFDAASARLPAVLENPRYRRSVAGQLRDAVTYAPQDSPLEIRCHPSLYELIAESKPADARAGIVADACAGTGFIVLAESGRLRIDGTLEGRLARLRPQLSIEVLQRLTDVG